MASAPKIQTRRFSNSWRQGAAACLLFAVTVGSCLSAASAQMGSGPGSGGLGVSGRGGGGGAGSGSHSTHNSDAWLKPVSLAFIGASTLVLLLSVGVSSTLPDTRFCCYTIHQSDLPLVAGRCFGNQF